MLELLASPIWATNSSYHAHSCPRSSLAKVVMIQYDIGNCLCHSKGMQLDTIPCQKPIAIQMVGPIGQHATSKGKQAFRNWLKIKELPSYVLQMYRLHLDTGK
jgi:hypothetical protein